MACVANVTSKEETLSIIENITLKFLEAIVSGEDPILELVRAPLEWLVSICLCFRPAVQREM